MGVSRFKMDPILSSRNQYLCTGVNLSSRGTLRRSTTRPPSASMSNRWFSPIHFVEKALKVSYVKVQNWDFTRIFVTPVPDNKL